jgi:hypothetical protein
MTDLNKDCGKDCTDCLKFNNPNGTIIYKCNSSSSSQLGLILMGVGIGVLTIAIILIVVYYKVRNRMKTNVVMENQENKSNVEIKSSENKAEGIFLHTNSMRIKMSEGTNDLINLPKMDRNFNNKILSEKVFSLSKGSKYSNLSQILTRPNSNTNKSEEAKRFISPKDNLQKVVYKLSNYSSQNKEKLPPLPSFKRKDVGKENIENENRGKIMSSLNKESFYCSDQIIVKSFSEK